jgi:hypothetical protein
MIKQLQVFRDQIREYEKHDGETEWSLGKSQW